MATNKTPKVPDSEKSTTLPPSDAGASLNRRSGTLFTWLVVAVIVAAGAWLVVTKLPGQPTAVSNALLADIQNKQPAAAYKLLSSGAKQNVTEAQLSKVINDAVSKFPAPNSSFSSNGPADSDMAPGVKKVVYTTKSTTSQYVLTVNLIKENYHWKVLYFSGQKIIFKAQ